MTAPKAPDIAQLQELPLPVPPFSYMPQTWAWLVLLLVVLALIAWWGLRCWLHWQRNRYRREALLQLDSLEQSLSDPKQRLHALRTLPELLKRVALSMNDTAPVAPLSGAQWQAFLAQRLQAPLPENFAARMFTLAYAPDEQVTGLGEQDVTTLFAFSRQWIEAHHVAV